MSANFRDGPASGTILQLQRTPVLLRAVQDQKSGEWDALDQLDDAAKPTEKIVVYVLVRQPTTAFVDGVKGGRRCGWRMSIAEYFVLAEQPDDATMRDNAKWREWCGTQPMPEWAKNAVMPGGKP